MALCADREKEQWGERASLGECSKAVSGKKDVYGWAQEILEVTKCEGEG